MASAGENPHILAALRSSPLRKMLVDIDGMERSAAENALDVDTMDNELRDLLMLMLDTVGVSSAQSTSAT